MHKILRLSDILKYKQFMRISSLVIFLIAGLAMLLTAKESYSQKQLETVTEVSFVNLSLNQALEQLQLQTGLPMAYNTSLLPSDRRVNYQGNKKVKEILTAILSPSDLTYRVEDGFVLLTKKSENVRKPASQGMVEVRGEVRDSVGILAGVSVTVKDKPGIGTTTDINGKYIISVPAQSTLVFSLIGYRSEERVIAKQGVVDITMEATEAGLDEVVVVGFGTQKKISLVGAQSTVSPKDLQMPVANLTNALAGRLAGVVSVQRTGEPGFDDSDIFIRGISTFSQSLSAPLILVDGVPRTMSNVDPEDIESFTILKDASATAVYGVRGANGVIIINTKKGVAGKPKFSFRYYEGLTKFTTLPEFADGPTYMRMSNEALTNRGAAPIYSDEAIQQTADGSDPYLYPNVSWTDALFNKFGNQRRGNININGGSDRTTYYVGANYLEETGMYKQGESTKYDNKVGQKRYSMTSNLSIKASNNTKIELGLQGYLSNTNYPGYSQAEIFEGIYYMTPVLHPVKYENGFIADGRSGDLENPYAKLTETGYANQWRNQLFSNLRVTQDLPFITKGLSLTGMFSFDVYNYTSMRRTKRPDTYLATGRDADGNMLYEQTYRSDKRFLEFSRNSKGERTIYIESALNYQRTFDEKHDVTGMLLYNQSDRLNSQAGDFTASLPYRYLGISGRGTYGYDNRYFVELNFGYNGSENFTPDHRYGFFPSVGLGWVLSEEKFFGGLKDAVQMAKIRFSHGKVGNSQIEGRRFAYLETIKETGGYLLGKNRNNTIINSGYNIGEYGVDVVWETAIKSNIGLDLYTAQNSLNFQLDFFKERRSGIFIQRKAVPDYVGLQSSPLGNLGIIDNKGFDANVTFNRRFNDFTVQLMGNITYNQNRIVENDQPNPTYPWLDQRGRQLSQRFGLVALGLFESQEEIDNGPLHPGTVKPGDIKFQDVNGDGIIDNFDRVPYGYGTIPKLVYGFGFTIGYKAFSLSSLFQGVGNVDIRMNGEGLMPFSVSMSRGNLLSNIEDRWTIDNPRQDAFYPRLSDGSPNSNYVESTWWVKNGRYLRLKNVQLSYNLPKKFIGRYGIEGASLFLSGYNVFTWSPFKFWDVELGDGRGTRYPNISSYTVGLTLDF